MNRKLTHFIVAFVIIGLAVAQPISAYTSICVQNAAELQNALTENSDGGANNGKNVEIDLAKGTYKTGSATGSKAFTYTSTASTGHLILSGGWSQNCASFSNQATGTILDGNNNQAGVLELNNRNNSIEVTNLTIQNGNRTGLVINGSGLGGSVSVGACIIRSNTSPTRGGGVLIYSSAPAPSAAIALYNNLLVNNDAQTDNGAGILSITNGGGVAYLVNNTITSNSITSSSGTGGIACCGNGTSYALIENNVMWANDHVGLNITTVGARLKNNDYGQKSGEQPTDEVNSLSVAPGFVDAANGDYHLGGGSPLIGAGTTEDGLGFYVIDGESFPLRGVADIGALEETVFSDGYD